MELGPEPLKIQVKARIVNTGQNAERNRPDATQRIAQNDFGRQFERAVYEGWPSRVHRSCVGKHVLARLNALRQCIADGENENPRWSMQAGTAIHACRRMKRNVERWRSGPSGTRTCGARCTSRRNRHTIEFWEAVFKGLSPLLSTSPAATSHACLCAAIKLINRIPFY